MLVLSRKERERIRLGDSVVVTVVRVSGDRVRLGIEAPRDMLVLRDELDVYESDVEPIHVTGASQAADRELVLDVRTAGPGRPQPSGHVVPVAQGG